MDTTTLVIQKEQNIQYKQIKYGKCTCSCDLYRGSTDWSKSFGVICK